jgi:hypothetical protein
LKGGGIEVLKAFVTNKPLGEVAVLPPKSDVAQTFDVPEGDFAARNGGVVDIMMGMDNAHFFPWNLGPSRKTDCRLVLFRTVLGKGLLYAGSTEGMLKKVAALPSPANDGPPEVVPFNDDPPEVVPIRTDPPEVVPIDTGPPVVVPVNTDPPEVVPR